MLCPEEVVVIDDADDTTPDFGTDFAAAFAGSLAGLASLLGPAAGWVLFPRGRI